ncbi:MAG: TRAP transporter substrate-binding protein DctP [Deltaproteobacteria bacterium]|nr:TRAP transporter substrate-binding protein DctP [Deltaproteobacteria bacterium]
MRIGVVGATFLFFAIASQAVADPAYVIKLGTSTPVGTEQARIEEEMARAIYEKTSGKVKVVWYMGAVLGDDVDQIRKTHLGQIDGGGWLGMGLTQIVKEIALLESPFFFNLTLDDFSEVDCTLKGTLPLYQKLFQDKGFVLVDWYQHGPGFFLFKRPVERLEDLQQFRVWLWPGYPVFEQFIRAVGIGNPVGIPLPEVLTSLQTGVIETSAGAPFALVALQWYTEANYIFDTPLLFVTAALVIKKSKLDAMPEPVRQQVFDYLHSSAPSMVASMRRADKVSYEQLIQHGLRRFSDPKILEEVKRKSQKVYENMIGKDYSREFYEQVVSIRDQCRATVH